MPEGHRSAGSDADRQPLWAIPDGAPEVTVEATRIAEQLQESDTGTDSSPPAVIAIGFDGIETDPDLGVGGPDEAVTLHRQGGEFMTGAEGLASRAAALRALARDRQPPRVLLFDTTADARDLAATTARQFRGGCVTNCLPRVRDGEILAGRGVYADRAYGEYSFEGGPPSLALHTDVLPGPRAEDEPERETSVTVEFEPDATSGGVRRLAAVDIPEQDLARARRIVAGGHGLGDPDGFTVIEDLADALGGALGASRPPADDGWVPYDRQIGVTGKEIDVELYVPCAISGDPYHMRSVNAEHLIPINTDPAARIFSVADLGIVGDVYEYGPAIAAAIREARTGTATDSEDVDAVTDGGPVDNADVTSVQTTALLDTDGGESS